MRQRIHSLAVPDRNAKGCMTDNRMNYCPCCHEKSLRHICRNRVYWFCPNCRQEMPLLRKDIKNRKSKQKNMKYKNIAQ